ncbi:Neuronal acetylcholine receptor subunit alpha-7 [Dermatophagoides farinae]|uniref:Neuronal acetylcholine receptor subunit alpha-7 n=2 Tax=Dermatophagoides farinae TaxID=6954 RepID=A0A922HXN4_DERFA|nr:Neuronal acetylcholine receptor subunit alpha-7 [Dermatophagoides farinae]
MNNDNDHDHDDGVNQKVRLDKMIILLAKSDSSDNNNNNDEYSLEIERKFKRSICTYFIQPIQFDFINIAELGELLSHPNQWSGIILTSKRCIDALMMSMEPSNNRHLLKVVQFFTVGTATRTYLLDKLSIDSKSPSGVDNLYDHIQHYLHDNESSILLRYIAFGRQTAQRIESKNMNETNTKIVVDEKRPEHKIMLEKWLNKNFRIKLSDNRIIVGIFLCTDCHQNIILGSSLEYLNDDDEDPRVLGLAMVPGKHIMSICVDEIIPS